MIRFEMDVSAADVARREIEGTIVPYGETSAPIASVDGRTVRFLPGSVRAARSRTPLLVDHDRTQPIGILAALSDRPEGAVALFKIDETPEGDRALLQAASGSRGAFSVGAEPEVYEERDGAIEVSSGAVYEVSLCSVGGFAGATVTRVAAAASTEEPEPEDEPEPEPAEPIDGQEELDLTEPEEGSDPEEGQMTEATQAAPMILAERGPDPRELGAGELVALMIRAQHGEREAFRMIEAVLSETISTDVTGLLPPQYQATVIGGKETPRPLYTIFGGRPLPGVGLAVNKPKWTTPPNGAWAANVDADATSTKVVVGSQAASVERWDWAGAISWVVVQRSDPSIIDEIYREAVEDFYLDVEQKIEDELVAAAGAANAADTLGEGIAAFYTATGRTPDVMIVAPDVWGKLADTGALSDPTAAGGVSTADGLRSTFGGIPIVASGLLGPGVRYLATKRAIDARITDPVRLTANAIGALNVELAVVGEGLFDTDYPGEVMALTAAP